METRQVGLSVNHTRSGRQEIRRPAGTMGPIDRLAMIVVAAIHISGFAHAGAADKTQALVDRAVAHIHDVGREQAFADFDRPDGGFVDGELYIFCLDAGGVVVANGASPTVIGHNLIDVRGPDGRLAVAEVIRLGLSQGGGWLEYRWPNPATRRIELKDAYVLKVDDRTVCGSGFYKGDLP